MMSVPLSSKIVPSSLPGEGKGKRYKFVDPPGLLDWIWSFTKKFAATGVIYTFGHFRYSIAWLIGPIALVVAKEEYAHYKESQRAMAAASSQGDEREIILARFGDNLPSWVIFPDIERAEWLNHIIGQLWPKFSIFVRDLLLRMEPGIRDSLKAYKMGSFKFEKIILGDIPPRIRGVKVYDDERTDRSEIILDMDIMFAGDCELRFSIKGIKSGIADLHLVGKLRFIMKPILKSLPLIGGIQYFFLDVPQLDFDLQGAANLFDMPGVSDVIRRTMLEQISTLMVLPNKLFIQISDNIDKEEITMTPPVGVLRACAVEARDLLKKDISLVGKGSSDPYVIFSVGAQQYTSAVVKKSLNPQWHFYCEAVVTSNAQRLQVDVYDHDAGLPGMQNDDFLGRCTVELSVVGREGSLNLWMELEGVKHGQIHLTLNWMGLTTSRADLGPAIKEAEKYGLSSALLTVRVDSAKNLPTVKGSAPDPYMILTVGKDERTTPVKEKTCDPVYEQTYHFLIKNPYTDVLLIKIMDKKNKDKKGLIGSLNKNLDSLLSLPQMKLRKQALTLGNTREAKIMVTMELKILKFGLASDFMQPVDENY